MVGILSLFHVQTILSTELQLSFLGRRSRVTSPIPAVAEQLGQAYTWPTSSPNTRAKHFETWSPQLLQVGINYFLGVFYYCLVALCYAVSLSGVHSEVVVPSSRKKR